MARALRLAALTFAAAFAVSGSACTRDASVRQTIADADALTLTMTDAVVGATDKRQGVAEAQAALDARGPTLQAALLELKRLRPYQMSSPLAAQWRDALIDDMAAVESLRRGLSQEIAADPALGVAVDTLITDFHALLSRRPT